MAGTMTGLYEKQIYLPVGLYDRLSQKPTEVVERFKDFNLNKYSFWHAISPIRTKVEMNIRTANKVLEERI